MSNSIALNFNNLPLSTVTHNSQLWLTTSELSKALGYSRSDSVNKIFERNKDEFPSTMSSILPARQIDVIGESSGLQPDRRIFSLRGCHLVAMFAKTAIAKEFRKWVLDILDQHNESQYGLKSLPPSLSNDQSRSLQEAVSRRCMKIDKPERNSAFKKIYGELKTHFRVPSYRDIPEASFAEAVRIVEGVLLGKEEAKPMQTGQHMGPIAELLFLEQVKEFAIISGLGNKAAFNTFVETIAQNYGVLSVAELNVSQYARISLQMEKALNVAYQMREFSEQISRWILSGLTGDIDFYAGLPKPLANDIRRLPINRLNRRSLV